MSKLELARSIETATTKLFGFIMFVGLAALGVLAFGEYLIKCGLMVD